MNLLLLCSPVAILAAALCLPPDVLAPMGCALAMLGIFVLFCLDFERGLKPAVPAAP
jgi:hypothetical protein